MEVNNPQHRAILQRIARKAMLENGLLANFSPEVFAELDQAQAAAVDPAGKIHDLRGLLWSSIDNDDSLDLDQLTVAETMPGEQVKIMVAVADVDALVKQKSAIDEHARHNTTSVYTTAEIFPMLPEKLSTGLTSLNFNEERLAIIIEMVVNQDGSLQGSDIYRGRVCSRAKLAYNSVAGWLEGRQPLPEAAAAVNGLAENLKVQDRTAQNLKNFRHLHGALSLETIEAHPIFDGDQICNLEVEEKNRAKEIIEDFMIAANGVTARFLSSRKFPSIRRVVRTPKRWQRIVEIAREFGVNLPFEPDANALEEFLVRQKKADPLRFPDLSLSVIKLLGAGEYVAEQPGEQTPGHFGLAVKDYTHSTAPNRRYTDLITQRLLKAALQGNPQPYSGNELDFLARHCTLEEDVANKIERLVQKSAAALLLESRIGDQFDGIITGASPKGTWVRLLDLPVEGKLVYGFEGMDVGHRIHIQLVSIDVEKGYIDFRKSGASKK